MSSIWFLVLFLSFFDVLLCKSSTTPWPELGSRSRAKTQNDFIQHEQNSGSRNRHSNPNMRISRPQLNRQDTFIVSTTEKHLHRLDTFIVPPKNTDGSTNAWNRGNPFSGQIMTSSSSTTTNRPLLRQDTFVVSPKPTNSIDSNSNTQYNPPEGATNEDDEIREFSENLLKKDINNAAKYVTINLQKMTTSRSMVDEAPKPLLFINETVKNIPSISKLILLYNNYILETNQNEVYTAQEKIEESDLLDVILQTPVMQYSRNFLIKKGKLGKDPKEFKTLLRQIWFNMYSRGGGKIGSSGFEHVFLAELKGNDVSGLHNWLYFNAEEMKNQANYLGYLKKIDLGQKGAILKHHFTFHGVDKPVGSMFIGTSPELEIALYSTCFILRPDRICPLKMNGNRFIIRTFTFRYRGKNMIGSAFPEI